VSDPAKANDRDTGRLHLLARLHGVQLDYWDVFGARRRPDADAVIAVLRALGASITSASDIDAAIETRRRDLWRRRCEPVCVSRDGSGALRLRLPARDADARMAADIFLEDGGVRRWEVDLGGASPLAAGEVDGDAVLLKHVPLPNDLPHGYHRCALQVGARQLETLIIAAPGRALCPGDVQRPRGWGAFLPLYALRGRDDRGAGDYGSLAALGRWIADRGGRTLATLPLLPTDGGPASSPSPYSPLSRLFWSEMFLDLEAVPELKQCPSWEPLVASVAARRRLSELRAADLVAYSEVAARARSLLVEGAALLLSPAGDPHRRERFERFLDCRPEVDSYARFRAARERHGRPWSAWPARPRSGDVDGRDYDDRVYRSHLFGQWLAHEQVGDVARTLQRRDVSLYLDLPLGVPHDSFDVWRFRDRFAVGVAAGAPPDTFFPHGQDWGLPPLHPQRSRERGHDYLRACLRHHLEAAGTLRIDHVMGLHRLFWVADGFPPTQGAYVRYPAHELWAIVTLESRRHEAVIVGEDLGTVPRGVRRAMRNNRAHRIYVVQTEIDEDKLPCLDPPPADSIACMNTHDMPTFASYRHAGDLRDLAELGFLDDEAFTAEAARREAKLRVLEQFLRHGGWLDERSAGAEGELDSGDLVRACLRFLADSDAADVVVNLEDLWLEERPQNVPGTSHERPNWRRRARYTLDEMMSLPEVVEVLEEIDARRRHRRPAS
jgi:4-alpha-glucanotransferase